MHLSACWAKVKIGRSLKASDRAAIVAALQSVSLVTIFDERMPLEVLEIVRPDFYVKGGDYDMAVLPESALVMKWGGRAMSIAFEYERSTTQLLERVRHMRYVAD